MYIFKWILIISETKCPLDYPHLVKNVTSQKGVIT